MKRLIDMTIEERVALGASELDERMPDWFVHVKPRKLDLASGCNCVLGQLSGERSYSRGVRKFFGLDPYPKRNRNRLARRGFVTFVGLRARAYEEDVDVVYPAMTAAWKQEIKTRKIAARRLRAVA